MLPFTIAADVTAIPLENSILSPTARPEIAVAIAALGAPKISVWGAPLANAIVGPAATLPSSCRVPPDPILTVPYPDSTPAISALAPDPATAIWPLSMTSPVSRPPLLKPSVAPLSMSTAPATRVPPVPTSTNDMVSSDRPDVRQSSRSPASARIVPPAVTDTIPIDALCARLSPREIEPADSMPAAVTETAPLPLDSVPATRVEPVLVVTSTPPAEKLALLPTRRLPVAVTVPPLTVMAPLVPLRPTRRSCWTVTYAALPGFPTVTSVAAESVVPGVSVHVPPLEKENWKAVPAPPIVPPAFVVNEAKSAESGTVPRFQFAAVAMLEPVPPIQVSNRVGMKNGLLVAGSLPTAYVVGVPAAKVTLVRSYVPVLPTESW